MNKRELTHIAAAIIILFVIISFPLALKNQWSLLLLAFIFAAAIIILSITAKKFTAYLLDADVEHQIWSLTKFGLKPHYYLKKEIPVGIILPLFFSLFSLGFLKVSTLLTYEARALKARAAKRFGYYSYTEITDWHNALIGSSGIIIVLLLSILTYFLPFNLEYFASMSIFYSFFNLLPLSDLDGTQIFLGSRILYSILAIITLIFCVYALPAYLM